ncbi:MAG: sensor histidine kinase, partial [Flammeovirgaceae bacterium]
LMDEDIDQAKSFLLGFSNILRYQVYECKEEKIRLSKEFDFLEDVFQLWKYRLGDDASIQWQFENETQELYIAPLIFYPFVENAFKYLSNDDDSAQNQVHATIQAKGQQVDFVLTNTYISLEHTNKSGIGLLNVQERLQLIYPMKHELSIKKTARHYTIQLTLKLDD